MRLSAAETPHFCDGSNQQVAVKSEKTGYKTQPPQDCACSVSHVQEPCGRRQCQPSVHALSPCHFPSTVQHLGNTEIQFNKCFLSTYHTPGPCTIHQALGLPEGCDAAPTLGNPRWTHDPHQVIQDHLNNGLGVLGRDS